MGGSPLTLHLHEDTASKLAHSSLDSKHSGESPFLPVLRSKGLLWLSHDPQHAYYWSHAGLDVKFSIWGPWPPSIPQSEGGFGNPRTELVFIGAGIDEAGVTAA